MRRVYPLLDSDIPHTTLVFDFLGRVYPVVFFPSCPPTRIRFPSAVGVLFGDEPHPYSVGWFVGGGALGVKKVIYILLTIFLCLMLLFILNAAVAIPTWVQYVGLVAGTVGGYFLGQHWWRVVYVQRRHWYFRMKDRNENKELA